MDSWTSLTAPPGIELRTMTAADLEAYKQLRDGMLARHEDAFTSDAASERERGALSYMTRVGGVGACLFTLLALREGRLLGAVTCEQDRRAKVRHIAHLVGMMVADEAQGQGLGRALVDTALRLLREDAVLQLVTLSVTASNARACRLYEHCGFVRYGRLQGAIRLEDGRLLDKDLMALTL